MKLNDYFKDLSIDDLNSETEALIIISSTKKDGLKIWRWNCTEEDARNCFHNLSVTVRDTIEERERIQNDNIV